MIKKILFLLFFIETIALSAQEKLRVFNEAEVNYKNGKLFKFYKNGAYLDLVKKYDDFAIVEIDCEYYIVESKFYNPKPKRAIKIGMTNYDVIDILGQPDNISTFETQNSISRIYIYGRNYYHFDDDILTAINSYQ